ncbi:dihydrolipoyl dehydrogenase [candidate division KSB1 bacterium]|nr:dihydrolipoyl dehydrogenase [Candidatus Aminicenantes bacterium]RQW03621.1 MAG: dihydrolipoyl dehydrogenase [candidate division KSB1 bacterium]
MDFDLLFIGAGPAGYEGAIAAAKKGLKTAVVEMDLPGGTCLQRGCIPTKAILHSVKAIKQINDFEKIGIHVEKFQISLDEIKRRKVRIVSKQTRGIEFLFKQNNIRLITGKAQIAGVNKILLNGQEEISAGHIVVATGSRAAELPFLKRDGQKIIHSDNLLELESIPESMLVVGAGAVGLEWALIYSYLGCKVTVVEIMDSIVPGTDREITDILKIELIKQNITIHTATAVSNPRLNEKVGLTFKKGDQVWEEEFAKVLLAVGRIPNSEDIFTGDLPVDLDNKGFIQVNGNLQTAVPTIFACGDVIGPPLLAHKASHQAIGIVDFIVNGTPVSHHPLPGVIFTFPEMATVGMTQEQAAQEGLQVKIGRFPYAAGSRANAIDEKIGLVKVIADQENVILGAHIVGAEAGELLPLLTYAVTRRLKCDEFKDLVFAHPTLGENLWEAMGEIAGFSIHI